MPKKPRQAHIPSVVKRRRTLRRPGGEEAAPAYSPDAKPAEPAFAGAVPAAAAAAHASPVPARQHRRLEQLRGEGTGVRVIPGQLPTFERAYLVRELRQIGIISSVLMAVIVVLTILLR